MVRGNYLTIGMYLDSCSTQHYLLFDLDCSEPNLFQALYPTLLYPTLHYPTTLPLRPTPYALRYTTALYHIHTSAAPVALPHNPLKTLPFLKLLYIKRHYLLYTKSATPVALPQPA